MNIAVSVKLWNLSWLCFASKLFTFLQLVEYVKGLIIDCSTKDPSLTLAFWIWISQLGSISLCDFPDVKGLVVYFFLKTIHSIQRWNLEIISQPFKSFHCLHKEKDSVQVVEVNIFFVCKMYTHKRNPTELDTLIHVHMFLFVLEIYSCGSSSSETNAVELFFFQKKEML